MTTANARNTDPFTSVLAGEAIEQSGEADHQRTKVLAALRLHNGSTSKELARKSGLDRYMVARRLPEITAVERGESRLCEFSGRQCVTWWIRNQVA